MILILDIDDTLADPGDRARFVDKDNPTQEDWDKFFDLDEMAKDTPIVEAQVALENILPFVEDLYFLTGRPERTRSITEDWLYMHYGFDTQNFANLYMRTDDDRASSTEFKKKILERNIIPETKDNTLIMIDDSEKILKMFKEFGIPIKAPEGWSAFILGKE